MADLNAVVLTGRLVADPELRSGADNKQFLTFRIAVYGGKAQSTGLPITMFIDCAMFNVQQWMMDEISMMRKGKRIIVNGNLRGKTYMKHCQPVTEWWVSVLQAQLAAPMKSEDDVAPAAPTVQPQPKRQTVSLPKGIADPFEGDLFG